MKLYFAFVDEYRGSEIFAAHSYRVEVNAAVVSGDPGTCVGMHVHVQDFSGRQWFMACTDGTWNVGRCDIYCEQDVTLMQGTFTPGIQTFALSVEVTDTAMSFYVDGEQLAFLKDSTYTDDESTSAGARWTEQSDQSACASSSPTSATCLLARLSTR